MINKKLNYKAAIRMVIPLIWTLVLFFTTGIIPGVAQKPSNLPSTNGEPVDFFGSITNILVYIILPLAIIVLYLIWRKNKIKEAREVNDETEEKSNQNEKKPNS
ncbi:MAG: hypothetical protein ACQESM_05430 [Bacteroidota bacterium]